MPRPSAHQLGEALSRRFKEACRTPQLESELWASVAQVALDRLSDPELAKSLRDAADALQQANDEGRPPAIAATIKLLDLAAQRLYLEE